MCIRDSSKTVIWERRNDLSGLVIAGQTIDGPPYQLVEWDELKKTEKIGGIFGELWTKLEQTLNFSTNLSQSPDGAYGILQPDGSWNGIVHSLQMNTTEVGIADFFSTHSRSDVVDFSSKVMEAKNGLFIKSPEPNDTWGLFTSPFSSSLWLVYLAMVVCLQVALCITNYFERDHSNNILRHVPLIIWSSMVAQGSSVQSKGPASRIVFWISYVVGVVVLASFSANLVSHFTVTEIRLPFSNLDEIFKTNFEGGTLFGTTYVEMFKFGPPASAYR